MINDEKLYDVTLSDDGSKIQCLGSFPVRYIDKPAENARRHSSLGEIGMSPDNYTYEVFANNHWQRISSVDEAVYDAQLPFYVEIKVKNCKPSEEASYNPSWLHALIWRSIIKAGLENKIEVKVKRH